MWYVERLRQCGVPLVDEAAVSEAEPGLSARQSSREQAKTRAPKRRGSEKKPSEPLRQPKNAQKKQKLDTDSEATHDPRRACAVGAAEPAQTPGAAARRRSTAYTCGRCSRSFDDWYRPTHRPSGGGFYCPLTDGASYGGLVNKRLESLGQPTLNDASLDSEYRDKENARNANGVNARERCESCRLPLAGTFHAGRPQLPGWRHCPYRGGDYAEAALSEMRARGGVSGDAIPSLEGLRKDRAARDARWDGGSTA